MEVLLHSYTFRGREFAECCHTAAEADYNGIELQRVHFNEDYLARELPERIATASDHGTSIRCVDFTADFMDPDPGIRRASLDRLLRNIRICADHGIRLMNGHTGVLLGGAPEDFGANGSKAATDTHYAQAIDALREAASAAANLGVTLSLEVHMNTLHDTLASVGRMLEAIDSPALACTPDVGNQLATPHAESATDGLEALASRIGIVHIKNGRISGEKSDYSVGLDDGDIDLRAYMGFLKSIGYTGPWCIEHVGQLDPRTSARSDIATLRRWISETSTPGRA